MPVDDETALAYYATQSVITSPAGYASLFDDLPADVAGLARVCWGLLLHPVAAERLGIALAPERRAELDLRFVPRMVERILAHDPRPLSAARSPERKLVGNCRDTAVLLCAMLRHQGRPARARAGFATYFQPGFHGDHWVCEYWREDEGRWAMADADLPPDWSGSFDPLDVPDDGFLVAGRAWRACRDGEADPETFGMPEFPKDNGRGWIASQVVRDLACLNKVELLCWDRWALADTAWRGIAPEEEALLDRVADATFVVANDRFGAPRELYTENGHLRVPAGFAGLAMPDDR